MSIYCFNIYLVIILYLLTYESTFSQHFQFKHAIDSKILNLTSGNKKPITSFLNKPYTFQISNLIVLVYSWLVKKIPP